MSKSVEVVVDRAQAGERLDVWLTSVDGVASRAQARRLIDEGRVHLNGNLPPKAGVILKAGDVISIDFPDPIPLELTPESIPLDIRYEDDELLVINKPRGMVVHPAPGHATGTLVHAVLHHCPELSGIGGIQRPGIVHRLDKETTGLLVVAKTDRAHASLAAQLKNRTMDREYVALVHGRVPHERGVIEAPIGRHPVKRKQMAVVENGRAAITRFWVLERFQKYTFLGVALETGRTHQIRVHLSHVGFPIVGDKLYGGKGREFPGEGYALHAKRIAFEHPVTGSRIEVRAGIPPDFMTVLDRLRASAAD